MHEAPQRVRDECELMPKPPSCRADRSIGSELDELVDDYISRYRKGGRSEREWYASVGSIEASIERAASCTQSNGKRHGHQRRIPRAALGAFAKAIAKRPISKSSDFDDLHAHVRIAARPISGIGTLTCYDVATRIGYFLRLEPRSVYLHAGTRTGARAIGLDGDVETLPTGVFPTEMQRLSAAEMEDFLCIYKSRLQRPK